MILSCFKQTDAPAEFLCNFKTLRSYFFDHPPSTSFGGMVKKNSLDVFFQAEAGANFKKNERLKMKGRVSVKTRGDRFMRKKKDGYNGSRRRYTDSREDALPSSSLLFNNLIWLTTKEAAVYLRKSVNSVHKLVARGQLRARKFSNRLYFKREEIDYLIETSELKGG